MIGKFLPSDKKTRIWLISLLIVTFFIIVFVVSNGRKLGKLAASVKEPQNSLGENKTVVDNKLNTESNFIDDKSIKQPLEQMKVENDSPDPE